MDLRGAVPERARRGRDTGWTEYMYMHNYEFKIQTILVCFEQHMSCICKCTCICAPWLLYVRYGSITVYLTVSRTMLWLNGWDGY